MDGQIFLRNSNDQDDNDDVWKVLSKKKQNKKKRL